MTSTDNDPHGHGHAGSLDNPDVSHEESDIDVATVLRFGGGLTVTVLVCAVIVWGVFRMLERQAAARDPQLSPLARPAGGLPPEPRLETNERAMLSKYRAEQTKVLDGYGWVDQLGGVARIPVAEAKKLVAQRGLPARSGTPVAPAQGTRAYAYGEASGGRTIPAQPPAAAPAAPGAEAPATQAPVRK
jgi:hypothetical protein